MKKYLVFMMVFVLSGCVTAKTNRTYVLTRGRRGYPEVCYKEVIRKPDVVTDGDWELGLLVRKLFPEKNTCVKQANLYAKELSRNPVMMSNGRHRFVVRDSRIYDSTHMEFTGLPIDSRAVVEYYGSYKTWREVH